MKWAGLSVLLAAIGPLSIWLRRNPLHAPKVWMLVGLMPFLMTVTHSVMAFTLLDGNPVSFYVHGVEFSVLDGLAISLYFSLPTRRHSLPLPFCLAMLLYFFAVSLSTLQSIYPLATLSYVWQLARMFLVYAVVARACANPRVPSAILTGMAVGIIAEAVVAVWQRFGLGILQDSGTFDHQNILGMTTHFVVFPFFALLLAGRGGWLPAVIVLSGAVIELLTASRATLGVAVLAYATIFVLSAMRCWTSRKAVSLLIGVIALALLAPFAMRSIEIRGQNELTGSDNTRTGMEEAAMLLISRYPLGVGANNYVLAANVNGANATAGLDWTQNAAPVHDAYLLVAAETGYLGLVSFLLLLIRPVIVALRCGWHEREDPRGDLLLGLGIALLAVYVHAAFEWVFVLNTTQYMLAITFGMIAGLARELELWRGSYMLPSRSRIPNFSTRSKSLAGSVRRAGG